MRLYLYKRGRIYWVRGTERGWKLRESTGYDRREPAEAYRRRRELELADPAHYAANRATVASAAERFMRELRASAKSPDTVRFYDVKVRHVVSKLGPVLLKNLTHDRVLAYTEARITEKAHRYSVHRELTALRRILKSAARSKEYSGDWKAIIPEWSTGYVPRKRHLSPEDVWTVIRALEPGRGAAIAFILATASDFSPAFEALRADIRPTEVLVRGTKTSTRFRSVPRVALFAPFLAFAEEHADGADGKLLAPWPNMPRDIRRLCKRLGLPPFTARDLRRTCATWLVTRGVPYSVAAKFLGHASTQMLFRVYGQMEATDIGRLIDERTTVPAVYPAEANSPDDKDRGEPQNTEKVDADDPS